MVDETVLTNVKYEGKANILGDDFELAALTDDEMKVFDAQLKSQLGTSRSNIGLLVQDRTWAILTGMRIAKKRINGTPVFKGIRAGPSELGWCYTRAGHVCRTVAAADTCRNIWDFAFTVTGTATAKLGWIGKNTAWADPITMDKNGLIVVLGVVPFTPRPTIQEIQVTQGVVTYNPEVIDYGMYLGDAPENVSLAPVHTRYLGPVDNVLINTRNRLTATQETHLLGITFGLGNWLKTDVYTTVST
jgi:hypothetical protein